MNKMFILVVAVLICAGCGDDQQANQPPQPQPTKNSQEYVAAGIGYLNQQDVAKAIHNFDMAIKTDPTNVENYMILGQVYMRLKQYERAIDTFSAAIKVAPNNPEAYYMLSLNNMLDGRYDNAEKEAKRSGELFMLNREEDKFKRSVALLKTIAEAKKQNGSTQQ